MCGQGRAAFLAEWESALTIAGQGAVHVIEDVVFLQP